LPLGYDELIYSPEGKTAHLHHPNVMMTGSMIGIQSIDAAEWLCREIMPEVWKEVPNVHVYLVGSNPANEVLALAGRDERIHVTGFVDDLASYLRAADVYVCPLRLGSGMRTRVIEALACGCVVVSTPEGVVGLECQPKDPKPWIANSTGEGIAMNIRRLLGYGCSDGDQPIQKNNVLNFVKDYSWEGIALLLTKIYGRMMKI